jgi:hypothetical protein
MTPDHIAEMVLIEISRLQREAMKWNIPTPVTP